MELDNEDAVRKFLDEISYNGFNLTEIRDAIIKEHDNVQIVRNVMLCFAAYSKVGNNMNKLSLNVKSQASGNNAMVALRSLGIKKKAEQSNDLTLPRVAIAFLPAYLAFRRLYADKFQDQTSSKVSVVFKDIVFAGVEVIWNMQGYQDFYEQFNDLINSDQAEKSTKRARTSSKQNRNDIDWREIAKTGYESDYISKRLMRNVLRTEVITQVSVTNCIIDVINSHKNKRHDVLAASQESVIEQKDDQDEEDEGEIPEVPVARMDVDAEAPIKVTRARKK